MKNKVEMSKRTFSISAILLGIFIVLTCTTSQAGSRGNTILKEVDRQMNPTSYETFFQIINQLPNGSKQRMTAYSAKQSDGKAVVLIVTPPSLRGRAALRLGDKVWTHFPGETKLRKSTLRHALVGGVFNNGDYLTTAFHVDHRAKLLTEDKNNLVLELTPKKTTFPYRTIELTVDKKSMRPTALVQFAAPGVVIKTITFDYSRLAEDGKTSLPSLKTKAEANSMYRSTIRIGGVRKRKFSATTFTKAQLPRLGSILK